jgi:hypothetical protein
MCGYPHGASFRDNEYGGSRFGKFILETEPAPFFYYNESEFKMHNSEFSSHSLYLGIRLLA